MRVAFVDSPEFREPDADSRFVMALPELTYLRGDELPEKLERGVQRDCFRAMNYLRFKASVAESVDVGEFNRKADQFRELLIVANRRLVALIATKEASRHRGIDVDQLKSVGNEALIRTVETFDYLKGFEFSTFAYTSIQRKCWQFLAVEYRQVRCFQQMSDLMEASINARSIEESSGGFDVKSLVARVLPTGRSRDIVEAYYGLTDGRTRTYAEISQQWGISCGRVGQIIEKAVSTLRLALPSEEQKKIRADITAGGRKRPRPVMSSRGHTGSASSGKAMSQGNDLDRVSSERTRPADGMDGSRTIPEWLQSAWDNSHSPPNYKSFGKEYRERERVGRLAKRWGEDFRERTAVERQVILQSLFRVVNEGCGVAVMEPPVIDAAAVKAAARRALDDWLTGLLDTGGSELQVALANIDGQKRSAK
jgi:RNA polymerase sigma factor (sigma-70 family)